MDPVLFIPLLTLFYIICKKLFYPVINTDRIFQMLPKTKRKKKGLKAFLSICLANSFGRKRKKKIHKRFKSNNRISTVLLNKQDQLSVAS